MNQYYCNKLVVLVLLIPIFLVAQNRNDFTAFGYTPQVVSKQLYNALEKAPSGEQRLILLDSIAAAFLRPNTSDSLLYYGTKIKIEGLTLDNPQLKKKYELKSLLYKGLGANHMGLLDEAIGYYIEAILLAENDTIMQQRFKLELAETYLLKRDSLKVKNTIDELKNNISNPSLLTKFSLIEANFHIVNNQFNIAETLINSALKTTNKEKDERAFYRLKFTFGRLKLLDKKYDQSLAVFSEIKNDVLSDGYYDIYTSIILNEGTIYSLTQNYTLAEMALSSAYVNAIQWNRLDLQQKIIKALVKLYVLKEDYTNAYSLKTQLDVVNQKITANQNQRLIKDLEFKYETLKKEKKINTLQDDQLKKQAEIDRQKTIKYAFLIGFLVVLVPIILLLIVYYQKLQTQSLLNKQQEKINQQEMKSVLQTQELELAKNTIQVQNKERDRIARELHDSIGANIAGIKLQLDSHLDKNPNTDKLLSQLDKTYEQVREISHSLIPAEFEESSFTVLIKNYIATVSQNNTVVINFDAHPEKVLNTLDIQLQSGLLNIIKELITNAFKHANATEIDLQISLSTEENSIELIYEDDGVGFDLDKTNKGIGLQNIEHRVSHFSGQFSINSALNRGTVVTISIPQQN